MIFKICWERIFVKDFLELSEEELENITGGHIITTLIPNIIYAGIFMCIGAGLLKFKQWISKKRKKKTARQIKKILETTHVIKNN